MVGRRIAIGSAVLDVTTRIDRCVMVTRPQPGGIEADLSVLRTLLQESDGCLGVGALVVGYGEMQLGDELRELGPAAPATTTRVSAPPYLRSVEPQPCAPARRRS